MLVKVAKTNCLVLLMRTVLMLWVSPGSMGLPLTESPAAGSEAGSEGLTGCHRELEVQIQGCLRAIEERFSQYSIAPENRRGTMLQPMCREYVESLQCLHLALLTCTPTDFHLNLIATGVGEMRQFMDNTCHGPMEEEESATTVSTSTENTVKNTPQTLKTPEGYRFTIKLTHKPVTTTQLPSSEDIEQFQQDDPTIHGLDSSILHRGPPYPSILLTTMEPDIKQSITQDPNKLSSLVAVKSEQLAKNEVAVDLFYNSSFQRQSSWAAITVTLVFSLLQVIL